MKVLIIGYPANSKNDINHCFQMMYLTIKGALQLLDYVEIIPFDATNNGKLRCTIEPNKSFVLNRFDELPDADVVIVNDLDIFYEQKIIDLLKTKYKKVNNQELTTELLKNPFITVNMRSILLISYKLEVVFRNKKLLKIIKESRKAYYSV